MANSYKIEIKWALIFMGAQLLWMVIERLSGFHGTHIDKQFYVTMFFIIPAVLIYLLALREKKEQVYEGQMNFKQGFISALIISVIITIFTPLTQWITFEYITPHYFDNAIAFSVEGGFDTSLEEAKSAFNYKTYAQQSTIWALFMGIVTSLLAAFLVRTKSK